MHRLEKPADSTHSSKCGLSPREQLERQVKLHSFTQDEALLSWPNSSPTWKAVPRRVVKGLPGVGPGEGLPSLPLEAWRPLWVRSHPAPGSTPAGSYMGSVGRSLPRAPAVRQRQPLRPAGRLALLPLLCPH